MDHKARVALLDLVADISLTRQAQLLDISRSSIYHEKKVSQDDLTAMRAIDCEFTKYPFYGSRRIRFVLARDHCIEIGREHVQRLMCLMGLTAIYSKPKTGSDPNQTHPKYPYLLTSVVASYPNHIWGTDITYIRLKGGFCYLVALLDWYSRRVVHWEVSATLEIPFCLQNLTSALAVAQPTIHNSDQGSHFTSPQYTSLLQEKNIQISMDGRGRCMDNIFTERLWRTVKYECIFLHEFNTLAEVRAGLTEYFTFYNTKRPHQSLDYQTPEVVYTVDQAEHRLSNSTQRIIQTVAI